MRASGLNMNINHYRYIFVSSFKMVGNMWKLTLECSVISNKLLPTKTKLKNSWGSLKQHKVDRLHRSATLRPFRPATGCLFCAGTVTNLVSAFFHDTSARENFVVP